MDPFTLAADRPYSVEPMRQFPIGWQGQEQGIFTQPIDDRLPNNDPVFCWTTQPVEDLD